MKCDALTAAAWRLAGAAGDVLADSAPRIEP